MATLLAMPAAKGLFHRATIESGATLKLVEPAAGTRAARELMTTLGIPKDKVRDLQTVPLDKLMAAYFQVVRRMNSQNAYHIFESVLHLHVQMQRIRGKSGWIDRKGEVVYLRHSGYEMHALEGGEWAPGYRIDMMRRLVTDLGRLP